MRAVTALGVGFAVGALASWVAVVEEHLETMRHNALIADDDAAHFMRELERIELGAREGFDAVADDVNDVEVRLSTTVKLTDKLANAVRERLEEGNASLRSVAKRVDELERQRRTWTS